MEVKAVDADAVFKAFTACPNDPKTLLLDVRPHKDFKKGHVSQAFNPRLATNGKFLADYSQSQYSIPWSQDCWWGKPVLVYGPPGLAKDHPIIKFLAEQQRCASLSYFKQGFQEIEARFPFLCTTSVKANSYKKFPSLILSGFLYLGGWADAEQQDRLKELRIKRIVTVHNHPERLKVPVGTKHLKIELPDITTADISKHFNSVYEFISEADRLKSPVLVHCGAGVSRSACLVMMYLMRCKRWSAQQARDHCIAARSLVCPNDGFWRVLCALEGPLGVLDRSDPNATMGFAGADAPAVKLDQHAAGQPVQVRMLSVKEVKAAQEAAEKAVAIAAAAQMQQQHQHQHSGPSGQMDRQHGQEMHTARQDRKQSPGERSMRSTKLDNSDNQSRSSSDSDSSSSTSSGSGSSGSSSRSSSSVSDSDTSSSDSGSSRERGKLRRPPKAASPLRRGKRSRSRSRSRGEGRGSDRRRYDASSRDIERHNTKSASERYRKRSPHKRQRHSRSRSRDRSRQVEGAGASRDRDQRASGRPAPPTAAQADAAAEENGLRSGDKVSAGPAMEPPQQSGWLIKLEVSKPEGVVGQLLLGPMHVHQRVVVGRAPQCDVVLEHLSISRQHAQFTVDLQGTVCLMDLGSQHGTKLNDAWIKSQQQRTMAVGSTVQFGASTRRYKLLESLKS